MTAPVTPPAAVGFTPGPWRLEPAEDGGRVLACDDRATIVHEPPASPFNPQVRADAALIASAPTLHAENAALRDSNAEMLAALRECAELLAYYRTDEEDAQAIGRAEAAIANAEASQ